MIALLDVNVLVAMAWPGHSSHEIALRWFERHAEEGWATCPLTQCGFVRNLSNPAMSPRAVRPAEAVRVLQENIQHPGHRFWFDNLSVTQALAKLRLTGHKQVTDAYLLALAIANKGKLVTLDRGIAHIVEEGNPIRKRIELLQ